MRVEHGLTLEQLAEVTGLSRSALGKYEADDFKDISPYSIVTLAQFYGVSADYLMGLTEQKNHSNTEIDALHLNDEAIEVLKSGKINNRLLCEMVTHEGFLRLLLDIEIYVDRIASAQINDLNALVSIARAEILAERALEERDDYLRTLEAAYIEEDKYFTHVVHEDIDVIIADVRELHRKDSTTADEGTLAAKLKRDIEEAIQFQGSAQERELRIYCNQLGIPYDKLTPEELTSIMSALRKSNYIERTQEKSCAVKAA